ncbi:hypothetical protein [Halobacillus litoralis]|uniref:hypothetical protein n=1 Tax=Halobacillus litoralis TaxID=45668 RepID=UPI001CD5E5F9|nr:hypothetical protein [Halobacillus litoralis]MCA1021644.1 hypothetical protein [Halobacillus litoralis]
MKYKDKTNEDLLTYFINQTFKMLKLYEEGNVYGHKHVHKTMLEFEYMPDFEHDYRSKLVLSKWETLYDELYFRNGNHQDVKNLAMESMKLLEGIKEEL